MMLSGYVSIGRIDQIPNDVFTVEIVNRAIGQGDFPGNELPGANKGLRV
jgi:hypothetical protein